MEEISIFRKDMVKNERFIHKGTFEVVNPFYKGFYADIVLDSKKQCYEVWLWHDDYGIKEFAVGFPVHNTFYGQQITETVESVLEMAAYTFETSIPIYIENRQKAEEE